MRVLKKIIRKKIRINKLQQLNQYFHFQFMCLLLSANLFFQIIFAKSNCPVNLKTSSMSHLKSKKMFLLFKKLFNQHIRWVWVTFWCIKDSTGNLLLFLIIVLIWISKDIHIHVNHVKILLHSRTKAMKTKWWLMPRQSGWNGWPHTVTKTKKQIIWDPKG